MLDSVPCPIQVAPGKQGALEMRLAIKPSIFKCNFVACACWEQLPIFQSLGCWATLNRIYFFLSSLNHKAAKLSKKEACN